MLSAILFRAHHLINSHFPAPVGQGRTSNPGQLHFGQTLDGTATPVFRYPERLHHLSIDIRMFVHKIYISLSIYRYRYRYRLRYRYRCSPHKPYVSRFPASGFPGCRPSAGRRFPDSTFPDLHALQISRFQISINLESGNLDSVDFVNPRNSGIWKLKVCKSGNLESLDTWGAQVWKSGIWNLES